MKLNAADQEVPDAVPEGVPFRNKRVACPHCGEDFAISVRWELGVAHKIPAGTYSNSPRKYWLSTLPEEQKEMVESFASNGILKAFVKAWSENVGTMPAKVPEKAIMAWMRIVMPKAVAPTLMSFLSAEFPGISVRIVAANGVAGLLLDDVLSHIIPVSILNGGGVAGAAGIIRAGAVKPEKLQTWIRSKYGYVAGKGLLLGELRRKCIGDFDKPGVTSN